ncbi:MAG: helix-turn-helix domain-containing protein [Ruminococcus sp.]|nr:helix-turn-helix domain-containing protein [Ruminococcus sp.]
MPEIEMKNNVPLMLGVKETAKRFGISQHYARQLALTETVKAVKIGRRKILINADSVSEYFNSTYINTPAPETGIKPIDVKL